SRRDGGKRYWCLEHKADATAKYGRRAAACRYADIPPVDPSDILKLDPNNYPGGVGIWGAVPAIYDTTRLPREHGIHVHARREEAGKKPIDATNRTVQLTLPRTPRGQKVIAISELEAIYFMVGSVFGYATRYI